MQSSDEAQKDVTLLEQVLMRLAVAQDDQVEGQLNNLLVPIIAKLDSPHEVVRKKVKVRSPIFLKCKSGP